MPTNPFESPKEVEKPGQVEGARSWKVHLRHLFMAMGMAICVADAIRRAPQAVRPPMPPDSLEPPPITTGELIFLVELFLILIYGFFLLVDLDLLNRRKPRT